MSPDMDIVIVGGGAVGLHAALKAGLLNMRAVVLDKGRKWSRSFYVPMYHNIPTRPEGLSGRDLLELERRSCERFPELVSIEDHMTVTSIHRDTLANGFDGFKVQAIHGPTKKRRELMTRAVILATGVVDTQPIIGNSMRTVLPYANKGLFMYCPICDGHLTKNKDIAVIGHSRQAMAVISTLRKFEPSSVTLLTNGRVFSTDAGMSVEKTEVYMDRLASWDIKIITSPIVQLFGVDDGLFGTEHEGGEMRKFDAAFSALGWYSVNKELGESLRGKVDEEGFLVVDEDCRLVDIDGNIIPGIYAVGDIRNTWNQVPIGWGDAEKAVIDIMFEIG